MKLWEGRFSKPLDSSVNDFNNSLRFDCRMYAQDIAGSIAHATMLGKTGIIPMEDAKAIIAGLDEIRDELQDGRLAFDPDAEDIHSFMEQELTRRIGNAGKRLHTARSRNDQVALDLRLYLREQIAQILSEIGDLLDAIGKQAKLHIQTVMPGYTHLQRAQPITFAHAVLAYAQMLMRDTSRLCDTYRRMNVLPLGSCALAGTTYPIDRQMVCDLLGFDSVCSNSLDGVSDRDFVIELAFDLSLLMMHLSRFSEEIILWASAEFSFIELDDAYSTGSSIMPQKKNPDVAELVRGKTGRVYGDLTALLTVMKGLPLAYNKDMQEDKEAIFDALDTTKLCLTAFAGMLSTLRVKPQAMRQAASSGFINATDCADYLVGKGLPFRDAYKAVGILVGKYAGTGRGLEELSLEELREVSDRFEEDVYQFLSLDRCVGQRKCIGGPAPEAVESQLRELDEFMEELRSGEND